MQLVQTLNIMTIKLLDQPSKHCGEKYRTLVSVVLNLSLFQISCTVRSNKVVSSYTNLTAIASLISA
jgi:hypothetical protein